MTLDVPDELPKVVEGQALTPPPDTAPATTRRLPVPRVTAAQAKTSAKGAAGVIYTFAAGAKSWGQRTWSAATHGLIREQIRISHFAGDRLGLAEWTERLEDAKDARVKRMLALPKMVLSTVIAAAAGGALVSFILLLGGITVWLTDGGITWTSWWDGVYTALDWIGWTIQWAWFLFLVAVLPCTTWAMWREGKRAGIPPHWLMTDDQRAEAEAFLTADVIVLALQHAVPSVKAAIQNGAMPEFVVTPREQGGGTYFQVRLQIGCTAAEVLKPRALEKFAGGIGRSAHEVWPQRTPELDARVLDCWAADKGTMDRPAPPWPLLDEGEFDVFTDDLPWGVTMRSEPVNVGMLQKHWFVGGLSKQGKTSAVRLLFLGLALDPTVELRIADLKGDGDFRMFEGRASVLIEGPTEDHAIAACVMLEDAVKEMHRRYDEKTQKGIVGNIPRELSRRRGSGFHPIYLLVDECQVMYATGKAPDGSQIGGQTDQARAWRAAKTLHDQARAVNIHLIQATQRPDNTTVPVKVREGAHVRASLYVANDKAAKFILGEAAEQGARPQNLRAGKDKGTVVVAGEVEAIPDGQAFAIVRTYYVSTADAYPVLERAMALREAAGYRDDLTVVQGDVEAIDPLADIVEVMRGEVKVRTQTVLQRLVEKDPDYYGDWNFQTLTKVLGDVGVEARKLNGGTMNVVLDELLAGLERRRPIE